MNIQLSDHFSYRRLIRFVLPSILMMIFTSLYSIVDGFFVSNFAGKTPFAAVNLVMPLAMGGGVVGFMIGTGGCAIVSKTLGEEKKEQASEYFTMLTEASIIISIVLAIIGVIAIRPASIAMGAEGALIDYCVVYGRILFLGLPAFVLQNIFQSFFVAAERPDLSLKIAILAGLTNMLLDFILVGALHGGIAGAAIATVIGQIIGGLLPILYFAKSKNSLLYFTHAKFKPQILIRTCTNGASEMVTNLSMTIVNILYNLQLMKLAGEDGVAAYGVIMYVNFVFTAIFIGYSIGSAPIIGYHYGATHHDELKNIFRKSMVLLSVTGVIMTILSEILSAPLVAIFVGYDAKLFALTCRGFRLYSLMFLLTGFNIWGSAFFTALGNGMVSAAISFLRTLVFQIIVVLILPLLIGIDGIWLAVVVAEALALIVTWAAFISNKSRYHYI